MGAGKTLKKVLIDKGLTQRDLARRLGKPSQTVYNTVFKDAFKISTAVEYGEALDCSLAYVDNTTGEVYKILPDTESEQ